MIRLALIAASLGCALAADPEAREIVRRSVANAGGPNSDLASHYNFVERIRSRNLDLEGRVRSSVAKSHEVVMLDGTPYRLLVEENGKAVSPEQHKAHDVELEKVAESRLKETPLQRARRQSEFVDRRDRYKTAIEEIPDAFDFRLLREETVNSRPAWLIEATPRPGYRPVDRSSKLFTQVRGKLWIDKADYQWARLEAELLDTVAFGWILVRIHSGSRAILTQTRVENQVWLPDRMWYWVSLRVGLLKSYQIDSETIYSRYIREDDDPRLLRIRRSGR